MVEMVGCMQRYSNVGHIMVKAVGFLIAMIFVLEVSEAGMDWRRGSRRGTSHIGYTSHGSDLKKIC